MKKVTLIFSCMLAFAVSVSYAETKSVYQFQTQQQSQQFYQLISELRCLVCQNENLADSNAQLAKDLRRQVYQMTVAGKSDKEIKQYLVNRYGDFVLFKPPLNHETVLLWFMPFLLLVIGAGTLMIVVLRRKKLQAEVS